MGEPHQLTPLPGEQVRGVGLSKGTLDLLFEQNWIRPMGRRRVPGRPVTWGTTDFFLEHFGLPSLEDLPGHEEMKAAAASGNLIGSNAHGHANPASIKNAIYDVITAEFNGEYDAAEATQQLVDAVQLAE